MTTILEHLAQIIILSYYPSKLWCWIATSKSDALLFQETKVGNPQIPSNYLINKVINKTS